MKQRGYFIEIDEYSLKQINEKYSGFITGKKLKYLLKGYEIKFSAGHWCSGDFSDLF